MLIEMTLVAAAAVAAPSVHSHVGYRAGDQRRLATIASYPSGRADDVRRPGFNGKLWIGESHVGPKNTHWPLGWGDPGPTAYGALDEQFSRVYARIGHVVVGISPWIELPRQELGRFESARQEWLKERGYVGGVRTFVNDAHLGSWLGEQPSATAAPVDDELITMNTPSEVGERRTIMPRATIQKPDDVVKIKGRQRVNADEKQPGAVVKVVSAGAELRRDGNAGRGGMSSVPFAVRANSTASELVRESQPKAASGGTVASGGAAVDGPNAGAASQPEKVRDARRADAAKF